MSITDGYAGQYLAGTSPLAPSALTILTRPRGLRFNPKTRDYDKDAFGRYVELHPVDAAVAMALLFLQGKIASAPNVGQTYTKIVSAFSSDLQSDIENRTRLALKRLISNGSITIVAIRYGVVSPYGLAIQVDYTNNRLLPTRVQSAYSPL